MKLKPVKLPYKLLTFKGNPKLEKGEKLGYWTAVLHLAPAKLSGFNVCSLSTDGCRDACLNTAGRGGIAKGGILTHAIIEAGIRSNAVQACRIARTRLLFSDRETFLRQLVREIRTHIKRCEREGFKPAFRPNGTSDIQWEASNFKLDGLSIPEMFPEAEFYDYTKIPNRRNLPSNYSLTFSYADGNQNHVAEAVRRGFNIAVVFRSKKVRASYMESGFLGLPVIDGDDTDLRFLDPRQCVVGLYAKGAAKKDTSGFVVD
jgi:hypothetical protein